MPNQPAVCSQPGITSQDAPRDAAPADSIDTLHAKIDGARQLGTSAGEPTLLLPEDSTTSVPATAGHSADISDILQRLADMEAGIGRAEAKAARADAQAASAKDQAAQAKDEAASAKAQASRAEDQAASAKAQAARAESRVATLGKGSLAFSLHVCAAQVLRFMIGVEPSTASARMPSCFNRADRTTLRALARVLGIVGGGPGHWQVQGVAAQDRETIRRAHTMMAGRNVVVHPPTAMEVVQGASDVADALVAATPELLPGEDLPSGWLRLLRAGNEVLVRVPTGGTEDQVRVVMHAQELVALRN